MNLSEFKKFLKYYNIKNKAKMMETLEYRVDLIMVTLASYGYNIVSLLFLSVIFSNIDSIAGWTKYEVFLFYGTSEIVVYIYWSFFNSSDRFLSKLIRKGDLDIFLLKPINTFANLITYNISFFDTLPSTLLGIGIVIYSMINIDITADYKIFIYLLLILLSVLMVVAIRALISISSFWITDSDEVRRIYSNIADENTYIPLDVYPNKLRTLLTTVIPVGLLSYVPTTYLLKGFDLPLMINYFAVIIVSWLLVLIFWKKGLKAYSSASS